MYTSNTILEIIFKLCGCYRATHKRAWGTATRWFKSSTKSSTGVLGRWLLDSIMTPSRSASRMGIKRERVYLQREPIKLGWSVKVRIAPRRWEWSLLRWNQQFIVALKRILGSGKGRGIRYRRVWIRWNLTSGYLDMRIKQQASPISVIVKMFGLVMNCAIVGHCYTSATANWVAHRASLPLLPRICPRVLDICIL